VSGTTHPTTKSNIPNDMKPQTTLLRKPQLSCIFMHHKMKEKSISHLSRSSVFLFKLLQINCTF